MTEKTAKEIAADKRRQAEEGFTDAERKAQLKDALTEERRGYVNRGPEYADRVKQVDDAIKALDKPKA